jgi:aspartate/methionine/tyrosine aminotransferase
VTTGAHPQRPGGIANGIAALTGRRDCLDAMVAEFRRRRDIIVARLNQIPRFRCALPRGAFYAFANVTATGIASRELADYLQYEAGVAGLDGGCFGQYGDGCIRFSYANSQEKLREAVDTIRKVSPHWEANVATR